MKPIIAIFAEVDDEMNGKVQNPYIKAIEKSGGTPILLPYVDNIETMNSFVSICDGFFFTGGADIDPKRYGEQPKAACGEIQYYRDKFEFTMVERVICTQKPILAICRGAQLINVALGGTLYQDIPSEIKTQISHRQSEPKFSPSHKVNIIADTPLSVLVKSEQLQANSFHHQAIKILGSGLKVMATADDGIIEAFYASDERYIRAYQWHPERLFESEEHNRMIFEDFIEACKSI